MDKDGNATLDKKEAFQFVNALNGKLLRELQRKLGTSYSQKGFNIIFNRFDLDKNGYLDKGEMAKFIVKTFKLKPKKKGKKIDPKQTVPITQKIA